MTGRNDFGSSVSIVRVIIDSHISRRSGNVVSWQDWSYSTQHREKNDVIFIDVLLIWWSSRSDNYLIFAITRPSAESNIQFFREFLLNKCSQGHSSQRDIVSACGLRLKRRVLGQADFCGSGLLWSDVLWSRPTLATTYFGHDLLGPGRLWPQPGRLWPQPLTWPIWADFGRAMPIMANFAHPPWLGRFGPWLGRFLVARRMLVRQAEFGNGHPPPRPGPPRPGPPAPGSPSAGPPSAGPLRQTALRGTALRRTALRRTALRWTALRQTALRRRPPPDRPKFRAFLPSPAPIFIFFSLSLSLRIFSCLFLYSGLFFSLRVSSRVFFPLSGGLLVECWWRFSRSGPHKGLFSPSGCPVNLPPFGPPPFEPPLFPPPPFFQYLGPHPFAPPPFLSPTVRAPTPSLGLDPHPFAPSQFHRRTVPLPSPLLTLKNAPKLTVTKVGETVTKVGRG